MNISESNQFADLKDVNISYSDSDTGDIPIIFIHGFPFDKSSWLLQYNFLKHSNRVICYDIRGFGKSSSETTDFSIDLFADDLIRFMDFLNIKKAIVCGLSMGGYLLLNSVNRYPDRFRAIILCDTQCVSDTEEGKAKRFNTIKLIEDGGISEFAEAFLKNIFCKNTLENKNEVTKKIKEVILSTNPKSITQTLKALAGRAETCSSLAGIKVPTLIVCGKEDIVTPVAQSEFLHKYIDGSSLIVIEGAGHMSNLEQPEIFNQELKKFIDGII